MINTFKLAVAGLVGLFLVTGCNLGGQQAKAITLEEARVKAVNFVNNNLMQPGASASIKEIADDGTLYKIVFNLPNGQELTSYLSKDGAKFFPQAMDIAEVEEQTRAQKAESEAADTQAMANVPKADKPKVELFVMSHCPYGTQIEKGIIPVVKTLGNRIDFTLAFCDYAMHGKKELDEQLTQYCIQKEAPDKLVGYLECFLADETKSEQCLADLNINGTKIKACVAAADRQYKVTEMYNDQSTWKSGRFPVFNVNQAEVAAYGISGSPGLVVNGQKVDSRRDPAGLLNTVCQGFTEPPAECGTSLSATTPAPGFGLEGSAASADGSCN